jgi:hypothetical protein
LELCAIFEAFCGDVLWKDTGAVWLIYAVLLLLLPAAAAAAAGSSDGC